MQLLVDRQGAVHCLYDEVIDLLTLGSIVIRRASHVEPDSEGRWWADLVLVNGPRIGPFLVRSQALAAERKWLEEHRLPSCNWEHQHG